MSGPRADYVCFRCEDKEPGTGGPFRDLPIAKPRCPNCGARKWMERQWSGYSPMISTGGAMQRYKAADATVETQMLMHENSRRAAHEAEIHARRAEPVVPGIDMRVRAIQPSQISAAVVPFGGRGAGTPLGKSTPAAAPGPLVGRTAEGNAKVLATTRVISDPDPGATRQAVGV